VREYSLTTDGHDEPPQKEHHQPFSCSVARIVDGEVFVYGIRLYNLADIQMDHNTGEAIFYIQRDGYPHSLNQSVDGGNELELIRFGSNISMEIQRAFREIDKINEDKINGLLHRR